MARAVFVVADDTFVVALVRGDLEVNETKLINAENAASLRPATADEIRSHGIEPGFGSAIRSPLQSFRGVEIGNVFQLGTRYSEAMICSYLDTDVIRKSVYMGSYGFGLGRLFAYIAEQHHDESGFIWPVSVPPYDMHLVDLCKEPEGAGRREIQRCRFDRHSR
jgi:prolyl-tRNA synthetase